MLAAAEQNTLSALATKLLEGSSTGSSETPDDEAGSGDADGGLLSGRAFVEEVLSEARAQHTHHAGCANVSLGDEEEQQAIVEVISTTMLTAATVITTAVAAGTTNGTNGTNSTDGAALAARVAAAASRVGQTTVVEGLLELLHGPKEHRAALLNNLTEQKIESLVLNTELPELPREPPEPSPPPPPDVSPPSTPPAPAPPLGGGSGGASQLTVSEDDMSYVYLGAATSAVLLVCCCCCLCVLLCVAHRRGYLRRCFAKPALEEASLHKHQSFPTAFPARLLKESPLPVPFGGDSSPEPAAEGRSAGRQPSRDDIASPASGDRRQPAGELRRRRAPGSLAPPSEGSSGSSNFSYGVGAIAEAAGLTSALALRGQGGMLDRRPTTAEAEAEAKAAAKRARRLAKEEKVAEVAQQAVAVFGASSAVAAIARSAGITQGHTSAVAAVAKAAGLHLEDASPNAGVEAVARAAGLRVDGTPLNSRTASVACRRVSQSKDGAADGLRYPASTPAQRSAPAQSPASEALARRMSPSHRLPVSHTPRPPPGPPPSNQPRITLPPAPRGEGTWSPPRRDIASAQLAQLQVGSARAALEWADMLEARDLSPPCRQAAAAQAASLGIRRRGAGPSAGGERPTTSES